MQEIELTCESTESAKNRLDQYLTANIEELTRARIQKLIDDGMVTVNGTIARASLKLKKGDKIILTMPPPEILEAGAEDIPVAIVYEDENLIVINKPAGMVVHPGAGVHSGTLVNALLHHCRGSLSSIGGVIRPGIVHRLDKDTSGLIVVAKNDNAHQKLAAQLKEKTARRTYIALVEGQPKEAEGTVNAPIGRHPVKRKEMAIVENGRNAVTHFKALKYFQRFTLMECRLETGRTHQIRVHMASLNLPVAGDIVYNRKTSGTLEGRHKLGLSGQALHAAKLSFTHPVTGLLLEFQAELPQDFERLLAKLK
jgi:23S rRNA pseudouridine1911/1915/1917 synthase